MALTLNGNTNTISGLAVGGLPDGVVDTDTLAVANRSKILNVESTTKTDSEGYDSQSWDDVSGLSVSITPLAANSKIMVFVHINIGARNDSQAMCKLVRGSQDICVGNAASNRTRASLESHTGGDNHGQEGHAINHLDTPPYSVGATLTYKIQIRVTGNTHKINSTNGDADQTYESRTASSITVMEVAA